MSSSISCTFIHKWALITWYPRNSFFSISRCLRADTEGWRREIKGCLAQQSILTIANNLVRILLFLDFCLFEVLAACLAGSYEITDFLQNITDMWAALTYIMNVTKINKRGLTNTTAASGNSGARFQIRARFAAGSVRSGLSLRTDKIWPADIPSSLIICRFRRQVICHMLVTLINSINFKNSNNYNNPNNHIYHKCPSGPYGLYDPDSPNTPNKQ